MSRSTLQPEQPIKVTDLLIRQKCEAMIEYGYVALRQFPKFERHVLAAEMRERHYVRYMDDFIVVHHDKAHLQRVRVKVERFLAQRLHLTTNHKTDIFPIATVRGRALDFLGYRIWPTHRRLRKSSIARITHTLRRLGRQYAKGLVSLARITESVKSWVAHALHADALGLRTKVLGRVRFARNNRA